MKRLSFASRQREGRSGEPGLPSILLPAAVETKSRTILVAASLPRVPQRLRSERSSGVGAVGCTASIEAARWCGCRAGRLPFSVIWGCQLSPWAVVGAWEEDHGIGIAEPRGVSGAAIAFVLQQNPSPWLQTATDVAKPSSAGNRVGVLTSLPPPGSDPGEPRGLSCCLEWEPEHSCRA